MREGRTSKPPKVDPATRAKDRIGIGFRKSRAAPPATRTRENANCARGLKFEFYRLMDTNIRAGQRHS